MYTCIKENVYLIPISDFILSEYDENSFCNPRNYQKGILGRGFDRESMEELYSAIKSQGLLHPLIARKHDKKVQLICGERRFRTIKKLIAAKELCYDLTTKKMVLAGELYQNILCRYYEDLDDIGALQLAFSENDKAKGIGDVATMHQVARMRKSGLSDSDILSITNKQPLWLRQADRILSLDEKTLSAFNKELINRSVALDLSNIENIAERHIRLDNVISVAEERVAEKVKQVNAVVEKAAEAVDEAEIGEVVALKVGKGVEDAKKAVAAAKNQLLDKEKLVANVKKTATPRDLNKVKKDAGEDISKPLTAAKLEKTWLAPLIDLIHNSCHVDGKPIANILTAQIVHDIVMEILDGNDNIIDVVKKIQLSIDKFNLEAANEAA